MSIPILILSCLCVLVATYLVIKVSRFIERARASRKIQYIANNEGMIDSIYKPKLGRKTHVKEMHDG